MTTGKKRVLIVDDHPILRQGISRLIARDEELVVCGEAEDAQAALRLTEEHKPNVAVVDLTLKNSNGVELIEEMARRWPDMPVLVLSMHNESFHAERAFRAGARGYVTKGEPAAKVIEGIHRVLAGEVYASEKIAATMVNRLSGRRSDTGKLSIDRLSPREAEIMELIGTGMQTREIAGKLGLSVKTVDAHRENIKAKLNLRNAAELVKTAVLWTQCDRRS